jgi:hypothetical protein
VVSARVRVMPHRESDIKFAAAGETQPSLEEIADRIFILESSGGKYVNCPGNTFNGYGWHQNRSEWKCYNSQEEVRGYVKKWFKEKTKTHDIESAACGYNTGTFEKGCLYYQKFVSL